MVAQADTTPTTIQVSRTLKSRLDDLKPYPSMSYEDLIEDMASAYTEEGRAP